MKLEQPKNINYSVTVVKLASVVSLPKCDRVQGTHILGNHVIIKKTELPGDVGLFFPIECAISAEFLSANNLYRKPEFGNVDPAKTGYFELNGRVRCNKFRGHKSEGFFIPISSIDYLNQYYGNYSYGPVSAQLKVGDVFDTIDDHVICSKYIPAHNPPGKDKGKKGFSSNLLDNQFKFHFDTAQLRRNIHKITPNTIISISDKWHGTSAIFSNILIKRNLNWFEKLLKRCGLAIQTIEYGRVYSSRKSIKNVAGVTKNNTSYYDSNVWDEVNTELKEKIPASYNIYGEIVGFTKTGSPIQAAPGGKPYHYGCEPGTHKFVVYRVNSVNIDGKTLELSWPQMQEFCSRYNIESVKELYYGKAGDLFTEELEWSEYISEEAELDRWQQEFLKYLEKTYVNDQMCKYNNNEVPAEGIVLRIDGLSECESYKLKNFLFLEQETKLNDEGIVDIETQESEE